MAGAALDSEESLWLTIAPPWQGPAPHCACLHLRVGARRTRCPSRTACSAGILELTGFLIPAAQVLGFAGSGIEMLIEIFLVVRKRRVDAALHSGKSGAALRIAGLIDWPAALLLRVFWGSAPAGRYAAASCFLIGALLNRYARI